MLVAKTRSHRRRSLRRTCQLESTATNLTSIVSAYRPRMMTFEGFAARSVTSIHMPTEIMSVRRREHDKSVCRPAYQVRSASPI